MLFKLIYITYNSLVLIATPIISLVFAFHPKGRIRLQERLGFWNKKPVNEELIWFHGASLGEIKAILNIIEPVRDANQSAKVLVTYTSVSALELDSELIDYQYLVPFDSSILINKALNGLNIKALIIAETELWPSLYRVVSNKGIPFASVNARISAMTFPKYQYLKPLLKVMFEKLRFISCGDEASLNRFVGLGANETVTSFVGNTKYDTPVNLSEQDRSKILSFFSDIKLPTLVLGSVRPKELNMWLNALLRDKELKINLIVAPRHRDKFEEAAETLKTLGLSFKRWSSENAKDDKENSILLLDTYGQLINAYSVATAAFIGATLIDLGGHNPMEASSVGTYVVVGPHYQNVTPQIEDLNEANACEIVKSEDDIASFIKSLTASSAKYGELGQKGEEIYEKHSGATPRTRALIKKYLGV